MGMSTAHDDYDSALDEALDRNTHRRSCPQNVAIFLVTNIVRPLFLVKDCGVEYWPTPAAVANPAAIVLCVGLVDRKRCIFERFKTL